jgi:acylphosphatase
MREAHAVNEGERVRVRVIVDGRVQGVYFRQSTHTEARRLGVDGWVRNLPDGRVEVVVEGVPAVVAQAVAYVRQGPPRALVTSVEEHAEEPQGESGFRITR